MSLSSLRVFGACCLLFIPTCLGDLKIATIKHVGEQVPYSMPSAQSSYSQPPPYPQAYLGAAYSAYPQSPYSPVSYGFSGQQGAYTQPPYGQQGMPPYGQQGVYAQAPYSQQGLYAPQPVAAQPLYGLDQLQFAAPVTPELREGWRNLTTFLRKSGQSTAVKVNKTLQELKPSVQIVQATLNKIGRTVGSLSTKTHVNGTAVATSNSTANATESRFVHNLRKMGRQALHNIEASAVVAGAMDGYMHDKTNVERNLYKALAVGGIWIDPHNRLRPKSLFSK